MILERWCWGVLAVLETDWGGHNCHNLVISPGQGQDPPAQPGRREFCSHMPKISGFCLYPSTLAGYL